MTTFALLLPWFVVRGAHMPPVNMLLAALMAAAGAGFLILVVVHAYGVARLRLATTAVLAILVLFLYGVGPFCGIPAVSASKRVIHLLDRSYSARPLAQQLDRLAPADETVAVFRVRRDVEYGLGFYRNQEIVNYEDTGVPDGEHLLVARVTGRAGVDLHTTEALREYLEGRQYAPVLSWPEQGLEIYRVGPRNTP